MGRRNATAAGRGRGPRGWGVLLPTLLTLLLVAGAGVGWYYDLGNRVFGWTVDPGTDPAAVAAPEGLDLPPVPEANPVVVGVTGSTAPTGDPARIEAALAGLLSGPDKLFGNGRGKVSVQVSDLSDGTQLFGSGPTRFVPASTTKLLTAVAALSTIGPQATFETAVLRSAPDAITLVGGGDPFLASKPAGPDTWPQRADVQTLATATAAALAAEGVRRVRVDYDTSLFTGPSVNPAWEAGYVPDGVVTPITALWVDHGVRPSGWGRVEDPARVARDTFVEALRAAGLEVRPKTADRPAPEGSARVASVQSAPVSQIVERVVDVSDNEGAEVLAHHVGLAVTGVGSFEGGVSGTVETLKGWGVDLTGLRLHDGSGLSRRNEFTAQTLTDVVRVAAADENPQLRAAVTGLPVAGFSGSLASRFETVPPAGRGTVRAKTGTLTGVHGLAGLVTDSSGAVLVLVAVANDVAPEKALDSRAGLDELAAALAVCTCSG